MCHVYLLQSKYIRASKMNLNVFKSLALRRICSNYIKFNENAFQNSLTQLRCASTDAAKFTEAKHGNHEKAELDAALEIEASLFDNSKLKHNPVKVEEQFKKDKVRTNAITVPKPLTTNKFRQNDVVKPKELKTIDDPELGIKFKRLNVKSPLLNELMTPVRSKKQRGKHSQIIIEGRRLILDALRCGLKLKTLLFSDREQLIKLRDELVQAQRTQTAQVYEIAYHDLKLWSTLTSPPGVLAIFEKPTTEEQDHMKLKTSSTPLPITVICDNIREPNNLGSIIRTCAALPCQQIVTTRGCCDPWESKALRGGCGGHFRLPIKENIDWTDLPLLIPPEAADDCCVFIAENNLENATKGSLMINYSDFQRTGTHNVVIIGGESHGVSVGAYDFLKLVGANGMCLNIPVAQGADSLNVVSALTLVLYELRKRLINLY